MRNYVSGLGILFSKNQKSRQFTNKATLRCFRVTTVAVEKELLLFWKCVFVASGIQHKMCMRHVVIYGFRGFTIFLHIIS